MNCKKCNAFVPDDSAFCPECGEKVEVVWSAPEEPAAQVFCPQCGAGMAATDEFCANCGYKAEAPAPETKKPAIPAKYLKLGIAAVAVVLVLAIIIGIFAGGSKPSTVLFVQDGALMSVDLPSGKPIEVTDETDKIEGTLYADESYSRIFYVVDGELVYRPVGKKNSEATKIAKEVTTFKITADGKKVFYIKNGDLFVSNLKEGTKIAKDVSEFYIAPNGKTVVYGVRGDDDYTLYRKTGSNLEKADAKKIATGKIDVEWFDEDLNTIIFSSEDTLYSQTGTKDKVKIASDADVVSRIYDNGSFYYTKDEENDDEVERTLYFYDGKKSTKLTSDYSYSVESVVDKVGLLFAYVDTEGDEPETNYYVATKTTLASVSGEDVADITINYDGTKLLILKDFEDGEGTLYEAKVSGKKIGEPKKIAEDVSDRFNYLANNKVYYYTDVKDNAGTLYIDGKKIAEDVSTSYRSFNKEEGRLYFFTDVKNGEGTLYFTTGGKPTKIADDVAVGLGFAPDGQTMFATDVSSKGRVTLNVVKGSKGVKIAEDVTRIIDVNIVDSAY